MKAYHVHSQIEVDGDLVRPGARVELTDDRAAYLLEKGAIAPAQVDEPAAPAFDPAADTLGT